jgi:L-fuconolactonase
MSNRRQPASGDREQPSLRIDAHHHLWAYDPVEYSWLTDEMAALRRDFLSYDLSAALASAQVDAAISVQARQSLEETAWLLACAQSNPAIAGVVGWAPLEDRNLNAALDRFGDDPRLVGFREIVQAQPDGFLDRPAFDAGVSTLTARGYVYDILIRERQLPEAIRFVDRHPQQRFVLDHAAKPRIASGETEPWGARIRELALRPNVACKLSGLVTEADWDNWTIETLRPYLDLCVEAFGTHRLLAGSDWPVCLVACSYSRWWALLHDYFAAFSDGERQRIFGANAIEIYRLPVRSRL